MKLNYLTKMSLATRNIYFNSDDDLLQGYI